MPPGVSAASVISVDIVNVFSDDALVKFSFLALAEFV